MHTSKRRVKSGSHSMKRNINWRVILLLFLGVLAVSSARFVLCSSPEVRQTKEYVGTVLLMLATTTCFFWLLFQGKHRSKQKVRKRSQPSSSLSSSSPEQKAPSVDTSFSVQKLTPEQTAAFSRANAAIENAHKALDSLVENSGKTDNAREQRWHLLDPVRECVKHICLSADISTFFNEYERLKLLSADVPASAWSGKRSIWAYAKAEFPHKLHILTERMLEHASYIADITERTKIYDDMLSALGNPPESCDKEGIAAIEDAIKLVAAAISEAQESDSVEIMEIGEHGPFIHHGLADENSYFDPPEDESPILTLNQAYMLRYYSGRKTDYKLLPYLVQEYGSGVRNWLQSFLSEGLLTTETIENSLRIYTIADFKKVLEHHGLSTKGKKADLIERLLENVNHQELHTIFPVAHYLLTEKGLHELEFYRLPLYLKDRNHPYDNRSISEFRAMRLELVQNHLYRSDDQVLDYIHEKNDEKLLNSFTIENLSDCNEYEFMASLDERTCEGCGILDGEHFPVEQAIPGLNYPPIHKECRCCTVSFDPDNRSNEKNMTWKQWKKEREKEQIISE